ncbi:glycine oxidase ThiO [Saccharopolyspora sp. HNM0986]|uniref:glycine oxidase ThiO n=1 Tax=Saccharopolyspora galaxeae TaxID=2781241 RepID=UPI00190E3F68|nr:glycine oxidase ThiO [Saccharopolyspora sp. HNM0986]MBK0865674.1 glycine oxidase ThiO [Saccharopolyspora sp. HNM0986]
MSHSSTGLAAARHVSARPSVTVVGGGVIGLAIAWCAARDGSPVRLVDAEEPAASWVAGGMLAPIAEAWPGEEELLELGAASLARWPDFAAELTAASGLPSGLRTEGTLVAGVDGADRADLDRLAEHLASVGREVSRIDGRAARRLEPSLGPAVRRGLEVPGDLAVDNRIALAALRAAATNVGVEFVADRVLRVRPGEVDFADSALRSDIVVIAAGAHSGALHPALDGRIRPVKGEVLRLRARGSALPPPSRTVRGPVHGRQVYLVPRDEGGLVVGATQYDVGFDTDVTVGGVRDLMNAAERLVPGIAEYQLVEADAGLRPGTHDNLPLLGELEPGVLVATGHHRNGFLLAPLTAEAIVAALSGREPPPVVRAAAPGRAVETGGRPCRS